MGIPNKKYNIIMILLDGVRYKSIKDLDFFQKLTKKGTLFSNMITYGTHTTTALHALFTGINGNINGADNFFGSIKFKKKLCKTLPEYLKEKNFHNYANVLQDIILPKQGFDEISLHDEKKEDVTKVHTDLIKEKSELRKEKKNFSLFLQYSPVHCHMIKNVVKKYNYDDFNEKYFSNKEANLKNYNKEVIKIRSYLKGVFRVAEELDLFKDTLFVVFSDHGASVGEKKGELGYGRYCYDYTLKSFMVFIQPAMFPVVEIKKLCGIIDIMPTILDLFKICEDENFIKIQGKSLFPLIEDGPDERVFYSEGIGIEKEPTNSPPRIKSVRTKEWKFIYNAETKEKELYNVLNDPDEKENLIGKEIEKEKAEELFEKMKEFDPKLSRKIKAVFFDFDGVMTKDQNDGVTNCKYVAKKLDVPFESVCNSYRNGANPIDLYSGKIKEKEFWERFYDNLKTAENISMDYGEFKILRKEAFESTELDEKMVKIVKKLKEKYNLVLVTDNGEERMEVIRKKYDLDGLFNEIVISSLVHSSKKTDKKMFELALKKANVKAQEAVFIDNNPDNLVHPKKMGIKTIYFDDEKRDYGKLCDKLKEKGVEL